MIPKLSKVFITEVNQDLKGKSQSWDEQTYGPIPEDGTGGMGGTTGGEDGDAGESAEEMELAGAQ